MIKKLLFFLSFLTLLGVNARAAERIKIYPVDNSEVALDYGSDHTFTYDGFEVGGTITIEGNLGNDPQLKIYGEGYDGNNDAFIAKYSEVTSPFSKTLTYSDVEQLNKKIYVQGKDFTLTGIYYTTPDGSVEPGETYSGTLIDNPSHKDNNEHYGLDLWMQWDNPNNYQIKFNQTLVAGDKLIFDFCEVYGENAFKLAIKNPEWNEILKKEGNVSWSEEIVLTDEWCDVINQDLLYMQGNQCKVSKIRYEGSNPVIAGGLIRVQQNQDGAIEDRFNDNYQGQDKEYDDAKKESLKGVFGLLAMLNQARGTVEFDEGNKLNFTAGTDEEYYIAGVIAEALRDMEPGKLTNKEYNGLPDESLNDPFNMFNKWGEVVVKLEEPVEGSYVTVYYRDLDYDDYKSDLIADEMPEIHSFNGSAQISVPLTEYRYIRAIAVAIPKGKTAKVEDIFLYQREDYDEEKNEREIWVPGDNNNDPKYEGHFLGSKQFYSDENDNDLMWDIAKDENGNQLYNVAAWATAVEIPGETIKEAASENAEYQAFALVYKDAFVQDGLVQEGLKVNANAAAQLQLYINFPFYQTDKENGEWTKWVGKEWNEGIIVDQLNERNKNIYVPKVREEHALVPLGREAELSNGGHYVQVPEEKLGKYTNGQVYIKTSQTVEYPVLKGEEVTTEVGNFLDLAEQYGLAVRGQNLTIMKVVYLGAIGVHAEEAIDVTLHIGDYNDGVDENITEEKGIIRHAFESDEITLEGLINLTTELEYGKDFKLNLVRSTTDAEWQRYDDEEGLHDAYEALFKDARNQTTENGKTALFQQYTDCGQDAKVDGFYRGHNSLEISAVRSEEQSSADNSYDYDVTIKVPCSGVYKMTFESLGDKNSKYNITGEITREIIIYPNLVYKFNGIEYGFNVDGYSFKIEDEPGTGRQYVITVPETWVGKKNTVTYIPGTYFANYFAHEEQGPKSVKRNADEPATSAAAPGAENYFGNVDLSAFTGEKDANPTPETIDAYITKNGASAHYKFLVQTGTTFNESTGVEAIGSEDGEAVYFNLQGVKVANPEKGIFVKVQNGKATKVVI